MRYNFAKSVNKKNIAWPEYRSVNLIEKPLIKFELMWDFLPKNLLLLLFRKIRKSEFRRNKKYFYKFDENYFSRESRIKKF